MSWVEVRPAAQSAEPGFGIYVHWPYCGAICPYCAFNVFRDRGGEEQDALVDALIADLETWRERSGPGKQLTSIFFGGGTPSRMKPADVERIVETALTLWAPSARVEVSLEANPDECDTERLQSLKSAGVDRLSIGVQSLDDKALKALGRRHSAADARTAVEAAGKVFTNVSIDLIYARPRQTLADWEAELGEALQLGFVDHVSLYELSIEPGTAFARRASRGEVQAVDDGGGADFLKANVEVCAAAGFEAYEISNYARRPSARSAHNLIYWRSGEWVGVGPGAHGRLGALGGPRIATETPKDVAAYVASVNATGWGVSAAETLDAQAQLEEALLMGLRLKEGVLLDRMERLGAGFRLSDDKLKKLEGRGFLVRNGGRLVATDAGRALVDRLVLELVA